MKRRAFLGAAAATIFAPTFGRWYRRGSGLLVPPPVPDFAIVPFGAVLRVERVDGERIFLTHDQPVDPDWRVVSVSSSLTVASATDFRPGDRIEIKGLRIGGV